MQPSRRRRRVIYFGRFQPFHSGHYHAFRWLLGRYDEVVVLIGMADESHTWHNPFTAGERMAMVEAVVDWMKLDHSRVRIAVMPTLRVYTGFSQYILFMFSGVEAVATHNAAVAQAFSYAGVPVISPPLVRRSVLRGEHIRRLMARGDSSWRELVPPPVAEVIERVNGAERIKRLVEEG